MPKRKKSSKVKYQVDVAFAKKQENLHQVLSRFRDKVNRIHDPELLQAITKRIQKLEDE